MVHCAVKLADLESGHSFYRQIHNFLDRRNPSTHRLEVPSILHTKLGAAYSGFKAGLRIDVAFAGQGSRSILLVYDVLIQVRV